MDDGQTLRSLVRDDAYVVERVLADGPSGRTEIVSLDGEGPLVRKRIPLAIANASAWAAAMEADEPLLPRIESLYRMPDVLVVVYDYVPGDSLRDMVERDGRLSSERAVAVIADVCRAVGALHDRGVVHRDITPGNVIVSADGAHLVDLGIARQRVEGRRRDTTTLGTWGFAAPEQYGFAQTDARSDVYALGRLLGYLLTGERPDSEDYERALADEARVPKELAEVVRVATSFEPSARYQSAADLVAAAGDALAGGRFALDDARWDSPSERRSVQEISHKAGELGDDASVDRMPLRDAATHAYGTADQRDSIRPMPQVGAQERRGFSQADGVREQAQRRERAAVSQGVWATGAYGSASSETASPFREERQFTDAPIYQRILAVACWILLGLMESVVVFTAMAAITEGKPAWKAAQYGMSVTTTIALYAIAYEVYRTITRTGPYAGQARPIARLLRSVAKIVALYALSLFVCALILPS